MNAIESELAQLAMPEPPQDLAARITARIAQTSIEAHASSSPPPATVGAPARERLGWSLIAMGATLCLGAQIYRLTAGEAAIDFLSPRLSSGFVGGVPLFPVSPAVAVLTAGLAFYLAGLLVPTVRTARRTQS